MSWYFCRNFLHRCLIYLILVASKRKLENLQLFSSPQIWEKKFGGQTWIEVDSGQNSKNYGIHILNLREVEVIEAQKH